MIDLTLTRSLTMLRMVGTTPEPKTARVLGFAVQRYEPGAAGAEPDSIISSYLNPETDVQYSLLHEHGIDPGELDGLPTFSEYTSTIANAMQNADLCGYNIRRYDLPLLEREFARFNIAPWTDPLFKPNVIDCREIFEAREPHSDLSTAAMFYLSVRPGDLLDAQVQSMAGIFAAQVKRYSDLPDDPQEIAVASLVRNGADRCGRFVWDRGELVMGFGQFEGTPLQRMVATSKGYLLWMLKQDGFEKDVKTIIKGALRGRYPKPPEGT